MKTTYSNEQTQTLGEKFGSTIQEPMMITLSGDMGAGKTEFTKGFTVGAGSDPAVSPTFAIMNVYENGILPIYHFDFYRMGSGLDLFEFEEYLYGDGIAIVEWSERMDELFGDRIEVSIRKVDKNTREFDFKAVGKQAEAWLRRAL